MLYISEGKYRAAKRFENLENSYFVPSYLQTQPDSDSSSSDKLPSLIEDFQVFPPSIRSGSPFSLTLSEVSSSPTGLQAVALYSGQNEPLDEDEEDYDESLIVTDP